MMAIEWTKQYELIGKDMKWYKAKWIQEYVLEYGEAKLVQDFKFSLQLTTSS